METDNQTTNVKRLYSTLRAELDQLKENQSATNSSHLLSFNERQISDLQKKCEQLQNDNETLRSQQIKHIDDIKDLQAKCHDKDTHIRELEERVNSLRHDLADQSTINQTRPKSATSPDNRADNADYSVPVSNNFDILPSDDSIIINADEVNEPPPTDIFVIADSHGRNIDTKKIYRNKTVEIKILDYGKKDLAGAREFINSPQTLG